MEEFEKDFNTETFILEVKKRTPLWDIALTEYFDREHKKKLWDEVADAMWKREKSDILKEELNKMLQQKWKNIRSSFGRELRSRNTDSSKPRRSYVYFAHLQFLLDSLMYRTQTEINTSQEKAKKDPSSPKLKKQKKTHKKHIIKKPPRKHLDPIKDVETRIEEEKTQSRELDVDEKFILSLIDDFKRIPIKKKAKVKGEIEKLIKTAVKKKRRTRKKKESDNTLDRNNKSATMEIEKKVDQSGTDQLSYLDFFTPESGGCKQADAPTIPSIIDVNNEYISTPTIFPEEKAMMENFLCQTPEPDLPYDWDVTELLSTRELEINPNEF